MLPQGCTPFREKAMLENPQIFQHCKFKNIFSAEHGQSAAEAILNRAVPGRGEGTKKLPLAGEWARRTVLEGSTVQLCFLP